MRIFVAAVSALVLVTSAALACSSPSHHHATRAACQGAGCDAT